MQAIAAPAIPMGGGWSAGDGRPRHVTADAGKPLAALVEGFFAIDGLRQVPIQLFVAATRIRDGVPVTFDNAHLSHDALLASACLTQWFPTLVIDVEAYWDGGFAGNPALGPLLAASCDDLLCILLQPLHGHTLSGHAAELIERSRQMAFPGAYKRKLQDLALICQRTRSRPWPRRSERARKAHGCT